MAHPCNYNPLTAPDRAPTYAERVAERDAEELIAHDTAQAEKLRAILQDAADKIARLEFRLGYPVEGYDERDLLATLHDLNPPSGPDLGLRLGELAQDWLERGL